jgi:quercetin dioxygenase-like cupin family protein
MAAFLVNIKDRSDISKIVENGVRNMPGIPNAPVIKTSQGVTRFLGQQDGPEEGPWVYYSERPKGDLIPLHRHTSNRIEFLISGVIDWFERGEKPIRYEAGTLSYVKAGIAYGYRVVEDAKILIIFDDKPGMHLL